MSEVLAQVRAQFPTTPADVWKTLITDGQLRRLFGADDIISDWKPAAPILIRGYVKNAPFEDRGQIIAIADGQRLRFGHWSQLSGLANSPENYRIVTVNLSPADGGTTLTLSKSLWLGNAGDVSPEPDTEALWTSVLADLAATVKVG